MMRKTLLAATMFLLCAASTLAQKKLFQNALEAGRQPDKFYVIHNDKNKKVNLKDLMEYADENDIILGHHTSKEISRFGDTDTSVESIEFLPKSEYPAYILANISPDQVPLLSSTPQPCPTFFFSGFTDGQNPFQLPHDSFWYGTVENGLAQGNGVGYAMKDNKLVFTIGNYVNGFPEGKVKTVVYNMAGGYSPYSGSETTTTETTVGRMSDGMADIAKDNLVGFVNKDGALAIQPKFQKMVKGFENGKAVVEDDGREIVIDRNGQFVDYSDHQKQLFAQAADLRKQAINMAEGNGVARNTVQSVELFKKAAELGDAEAQFWLGRCYHSGGEGVEEDFAQAMKWYEKAAANGNAKAIRSLGVCYENGNGVTKDLAKAQELYRKAFPGIRELAQKGDADGQFYLGHCYMSGNGVSKDQAQAVEWYTRAAEQGLARAQNRLGWCYEFGDGVEKDPAQAVQWYRKGAEQGFASAQNNLAISYQNGTGVEKDIAQAVQWFRNAAEQNYAPAQSNLGACYENGTGVPKSETMAAAWYGKSAQQGCKEGQYNLGNFYYSGRGGLEKDLDKAFSLFSKSAEQGDSYAQHMLGQCYYNGNGVSRDYTKAVEWYRKAAEQGYSNSQWSLAYCYHNGEGVTQDYAQAVEWYRKAAEQGHTGALNSLGYCYERGEGLPEDMTKAAEMYKKAAEQGNDIAMSNLANCYRYGNGVAKNMQKAIEWYEKAEAMGNQQAATELEEIRDENAKKAKLAQFAKRLGYNPDGTTIQQLVKVGRNISAVIDYVNNYYVRGYDYFINLYWDFGGSSKTYRLYRTTSKDYNGTRHGTFVAEMGTSGGKITYVNWRNGY